MKLKTLKDIKLSFVEEIVVRDTIKQEAIKWVKNCCGDAEYSCPACDRFMDFFNILKEDLK